MYIVTDIRAYESEQGFEQQFLEIEFDCKGESKPTYDCFLHNKELCDLWKAVESISMENMDNVTPLTFTSNFTGNVYIFDTETQIQLSIELMSFMMDNENQCYLPIHLNENRAPFELNQ